MLDKLADSSQTDAPLADLGPLAWVFEELRKSFDGANKAIRRFVRETEQSRYDDLEAVDPGSLRLARQQLHQAVGALEMVGLVAPAQVLRAMEAAVQRFVKRPQICTTEAADKIERASFALIEYLEAVLNNKPVHAVALFPQYREVQELAGAERVHPADLWNFEHRGTHVQPPQDVSPKQCNATLRSMFDRLVLLVVKTQSPAAALQLAKLSASLSAGASEAREQTFWRVVAGYFEALGYKFLPPDLYAKRATSRILLQFASFVQGKTQVSETLLHDLLFLCAQSENGSPEQAPNLLAVKQAFGLVDERPVNYHQATLGRYDPAVLAQARKRIHTAKEAWSLFSGGDASRSRQVVDQFGLVADSLLKLHPASTVLAQALVKAAEQATREIRGVRPELAMEVATTTLYLEAAFEDFDPNAHELTERTQALAARLESVLAGEPAQPLDTWMEQLYRRVSDRQTMGSVVGELKASLTEAEKSLDQFFRAPVEKAGLHVAVSQLGQMRGVLSVLGLDQAVQTVARMRTVVDQILDTEVDEAMAREAGTFQQLGNNLSALSFLVDMLNYQPALAKKLFVFDEEKGELLPLMGRTLADKLPEQPAREDAQAIDAGVQRVVEGVQDGVNLADLSEQLDTLASQASLAEQPEVARAAREAAQAVIHDDPKAGAQALVDLSIASAQAPSEPRDMPVDDALGEEDDLLDIFLEEAREVVHNGQEAVSQLQAQPADLEHLTTLRRAFHTLKGSSRMVGLIEFGDAAWAMEQMLNAALAEQGASKPEMLRLAGEAMAGFSRWVQDIEGRTGVPWSAQPFRDSAESWRNQAVYRPLVLPEAQAAAVETASVAEPEADPFALELAQGSDVVAVEAVDVAALPEHEDAAPLAVEASEQGDAAEQLLSEGIELDAGTPEASRDELPPLHGHADFVDTSTFGGDLGMASDPVFIEVPGNVASQPMFSDIDMASLSRFSSFAAPEAPVAEHTPAAEAPADDAPVEAIEVTADAQPIFESGVDLAVEEALPVDDGIPVLHAVEVSEEGSRAHDIPVDVPELLDEVPDDQTKVIGDLRIGIKLYNVYLNEADEWSRRLVNCLGEWALERHEPLTADAESLAHSLAGSSATVGFESLSRIARALEHALNTVSQHQEGGQQASAEHAQLFVDASEDIRRLLHQFAAGFIKEPNAELLDALYRVVHEPWPEAAADLVVEAPEVPIAPSDADISAPSLMVTEFEPLHAPEDHADHAVVQDIDDDIDVLDTIDADLFPIFTEEALELLPQLGGALRQWVARPDNNSARAEVLRNLHTLKGSARLAGALRLGEMAHRMETDAERMGSDVKRSADLEPLEAAFDAITARFDVLRHAEHPSEDLTPLAEIVVPADIALVAPEDAAPEAQAEEQTATSTPASPVAESLSNLTLPRIPMVAQARAGAAVRVRPELLDRLVNQAGEVIITRSRMESELVTLRGSLKDLTGNLDRLRMQLRDIELQAETQMQSRLAQARDADQSFDPLEFDRFTRVQELTRMMAESVNDVATVQRNLQRAVEATEDGLVAQARQTRELQRDLLRTRMVEFEGISERLYRVVRQASKETHKQVRLDITGGNIEMDRGVLDRMTAAFEHLLRNSVVHGIESPDERAAAGKPHEGRIEIRLAQELNDVSVVFSDDGAGLDLDRLREKALAQGLVQPGVSLSDAEAAQLVFEAGLSTAQEVSELAGRGIGMDVVRADVVALGGRIETSSERGQGASFKLVLPLTTAVTQVVMVRAGALTLGVPSNIVELVRRVSAEELAKAYETGTLHAGAEDIPFYWAGALLQSSPRSVETARTLPVVIFRSAAQRVAMHVDAVLGNQEVVVKNLGSQLSRLPGLAGMSILASGAVALIYNPVALATVYGAQVHEWVAAQAHTPQPAQGDTLSAADLATNAVPLILVVDDSITVRRVTQRLLQREGYRVSLAADGLQALERLQQERPTVVLSDIEMPRMDGFDLVRNIRGDARLAGLPVIMITSRIAEKHREHARELGVDHYLGKPYAEDELLALIGHYAQLAAEQA
ncbi:chemosensory pili system protein ChpA (sensor histidine kinase/response regulator) [Hydrogenophaga palleronii]|uniref:histidine kinase n=1 Tax=Hydrogenophaga palleronii TaxID=65655 RepID=A0ABU1WLW1_9BURK|nr:Hpt domain-containing protein [Hydrogenophaga palleronii]MDR7150273.1 chemosensory pili system protein ChpA (sensor histidine kinase/response regulator) [Hydrogenophaga palleronii]